MRCSRIVGNASAATVAVVVVGLAAAVARRFVQDDAFISFRYARNFANGLGLVWNAGERVEGYTNFLWTLLMAPAFRLGVDVVVWSWTLSIICFVAVLVLMCRWRGIAESRSVSAAVLVAVNFSLSSYATGGLETQLVTLSVVASAWFLGAGRFLAAAIAATVSVLTRMDSVLLLAPFWIGTLFPDGLRGGLRLRPLAPGLAFAGLIFAAWMLWRHSYYGAWLPNTFLVKSGASPVRGIIYVALFFGGYGWFIPPLVAAATSCGRDGMRDVIRRHREMVWAVALHLAYVALVGGDFMEFRMIAPCAPFAALLLAEFIAGNSALFVLLLVAAPFGARAIPSGHSLAPIVSLQEMASGWLREGDALSSILGSDGKNVRIALTPAGAIPFRTGLWAFDELGLCSREVAMNGDRIKPVHRILGNMPGHCVKATWSQLRDARVNLVIDHPWTVREQPEEVLPFDSQGRVRRVEFNSIHPFISVDVPPESGAKVVVWPLPDGRWWIMVLAEPCGSIDEAIARSGAKVFDFDS